MIIVVALIANDRIAGTVKKAAGRVHEILAFALGTAAGDIIRSSGGAADDSSNARISYLSLHRCFCNGESS